MKKMLFTIVLLCIMQFCVSQQVGKGLALTINQVLDVKYMVYYPAIKIKLVDKQTDIDYTKKKGLLQSFFSANNAVWAQSDYADTLRKTAKDEEHFRKIKTLDRKKNYMNYESSYDFIYNGKEMSYIKYSIKLDGLPFELLGIMSASKKNNRWVILDLPNQIEILSCLTKMDNQKLLAIIKKQKFNDLITNNLINSSTTNNIFNWNLFYESFNTLSENENKKIRDERLWNSNYTKPNSLKSASDSVFTKVIQPLILEQSTFTTYQKKGNILKHDSLTMVTFKNNPESLLIPANKDSILLVHKFSFFLKSNNYTIIKYLHDRHYDVKIISDNNGSFSICDDNELVLFSSFIKIIKSSTLFDILNNNTKDNTLISIIKKSTGINMDLNLSTLCELILQNKTKLSQLLDL